MRGRLRLRHHQHVALVDRLPAADAGAVEAQAVLEDVLVELVDRNGEVLPQPGEVHEPQVDGLDVLFPAQRQYFFGSHKSVLSSKNHVGVEANRHAGSLVLLGTLGRHSAQGVPVFANPVPSSPINARRQRPQSLFSSGLEMTIPSLARCGRRRCRVRFISDACVNCKHQAIVASGKKGQEGGNQFRETRYQAGLCSGAGDWSHRPAKPQACVQPVQPPVPQPPVPYFRCQPSTPGPDVQIVAAGEGEIRAAVFDNAKSWPIFPRATVSALRCWPR